MIGLSTKTDIQMRAVYSSFIPTNSFGKRQQFLKIRYKKCKDKDELYFSGTQVLGHFCVSGAFSNSNRSNPSLTLQTMLDACIQNFFFRVSTLYRVEGGRTARKFRKGCTVLRRNRQMTEKYEYCSLFPRTFVQDCRL